MPEQNLKNQDALIARNAQTSETGVVTGLNADGSPQMDDPAKAAKFLTFDRNADILDNFLRNFAAQYKNPTMFNFFKVPADQMPTVGFAVNQMAKDMEANKEMLATCEVKIPDAPKQEAEQKAESTQQQEAPKYERPQAIDENSINWNNLAAWGITKDSLGEQNLKNMLNNKMSDLVTVTPTFGNEKFELEARLSLRQNPDGSVKVVPHFIRQEPNLSEEFHGVKFTKEDKEMLKATGNLGRVIDLKTPDGKVVPSFVSIDRKTNELIALPAAAIYIRNKIGETELSPKEIGFLRSGKQMSKEVTLSNGKTFPTVLQISAAEQKVEFVPVHARLYEQKSQEQSNGQKQEGNEKSQSNNWTLQDGSIKPLGKWKGVEFSNQQKADYVAGKTIKVDGVPDAKGVPSSLYIRFNPEKQRPYTFSYDPDKAKVITPAEESKAQVAVNSEGKTQEATKHLKGPLEQGQTQPKPGQKKKGQKL
ncbi:MAG: DUF3945 domain-containing protein [Duncaniella dubosii]|uniref:DUF4099 domain-containing protein n=1 Tax=Duncaniella dubosii TaxID=2518971 RepID=UPI00352900DD